MPYEIPQELQYQEKIIFGLTFKQLAYAFLFGPAALAIFFKTNINLYARIFLTLIPSGLAIMFMFFNLAEHMKNWIGWIRFRNIKEGDKKTDKKLQQYIEIKNIEDNCINASKKIAVLKVEPINFAIKTEEEQEAITKAFQKFLNSLDFPVQIAMATAPLTLDKYLNSLHSRVEERFEELFEEYKEFLLNVIEKESIINRNFYVIIPETIGIEIQARICEERLKNLGLRPRRLNTKELKEFIKKFLHIGRIENKANYIQIDDKFNRIIYAHGYPRIVQNGFLDKIVTSKGNFDLSLHIIPYSIENTLIMLNRELQKQRADLYAAELKSVINPSLEIQYRDTKKILENLQKGYEKLFNISLYVNCKADTRAELDLLTKKVEAELNSLMIIPKVPQFRMAQGFKSVMPLGADILNATRNITTGALSAFFPFTSPFLQIDESGICFGLNKNNVPVIRDIFKLSNPNGCILASSGAGKSYMAKLLISRHLLNGTKVMVIDPQSEYRDLVKLFGGQLIKLSRTSTTMLNPLDLMGHNYPEKRLVLMDLMQVMLGEMSEAQKSFIDKALTLTYERAGITNEPETWQYEPPILGDLLQSLEIIDKKTTAFEKATVRSLINRLSMYVDGVFSFLNRRTSIDFSKEFVCFDLGDIPKQVKPVIMFLVLDYVYMRMRSDIERKVLVVDEAWSLLSRAEDAYYIFEIVKTCRKFNLGLLLINQEVEGLLESKAGKSVLANSAYTILMKQKPAVISAIHRTFNLSQTEIDNLITAPVGEGILIIENDHHEIKVIASEKEDAIITTNADERLEQEKQKEEESEEKINEKKVEIKVDLSERIYKKSSLSEEEIKYLTRKGYKETKHLGITSKKAERYLVKQKRGESLGHFFLVYDIQKYLKKFTDKIWLYETIKPDIVFQIGNKKIAVEIETGKTYRFARKKLMEKVNQLNETYKEWFFVVTDINLVKKYKKFGKTYTKRNIAKKLEGYFKNSKK